MSSGNGLQPPGSLLSPADVAQRLSIPVKAVYTLIQEKGLPAFRVGRKLRIRQDELDSWLEGNRISITTSVALTRAWFAK